MILKPKFHIFVCSSSRLTGEQKGMCMSKGTVRIVNEFISELQEREIEDDVMLTTTGCLGICGKGPVVIIYPEGTWYGKVTPDDIEEIVESHIEKGKIVERLLI